MPCLAEHKLSSNAFESTDKAKFAGLAWRESTNPLLSEAKMIKGIVVTENGRWQLIQVFVNQVPEKRRLFKNFSC